MHEGLSTIESYSRDAVVNEGRWIAGTRGATLADVCLASVVKYARDMYGKDLRRSREVIGKWVEKWDSTEAGRPGGEKTPPREMSEVAKRWK